MVWSQARANPAWMPTVSPDWLPDDWPSSKEFCNESHYGILGTLLYREFNHLCSLARVAGRTLWRQLDWDIPSEWIECITSLCALSCIANSPFREDFISIMDDAGVNGLSTMTPPHWPSSASWGTHPNHLVHVHGRKIADFNRFLRDMENGTTQAKQDSGSTIRYISNLQPHFGVIS